MKHPMNLEKIKVPELEVDAHKKLLKQYLFSRDTGSKKTELSFLKGGDFVKNHRYIFSGAVIAVLVLIIGTAAYLGGFTIFAPQEASAKEIVEEAFDKFISLTPEQQEELEKLVQADLRVSLLDAQDAADLEIVPESEIVRVEKESTPSVGKGDVVYGSPAFTVYEPGGSTDPREQKVVPGTRVFFGDGKIEVIKGVKVVWFTDKSGQKTILGINEMDEPVMKMVVMDKSKIQMMETNGQPVSAPVFEWSQIKE